MSDLIWAISDSLEWRISESAGSALNIRMETTRLHSRRQMGTRILAASGTSTEARFPINYCLHWKWNVGLEFRFAFAKTGGRQIKSHHRDYQVFEE